MIDREGRNSAAEVLRQFFSGRFSQFDFEKKFPGSIDPAIGAVDHTVWCFYDDFCEHKMTGEWKLTPEWRRIIARWVMFLHSDFEYELPDVITMMIDDGLKVMGKVEPVAPNLTTQRDLLRLNFNYLKAWV